MRFLRNCLTICLISIIVFGCASIVSRSEYDVTITSSPPDSYITVTDIDGFDVFSGSTPAYVTLPADAGYFVGARYTVRFEKEGFQTQTLILRNKIDGWYFGNLLLGGIIGMLIIDPLTGAMWKLPPNLHASLQSGMNSINIDDQNVEFTLYEDVPEDLKEHLIPIE
ncbi:hypothetical protein ACFLYK_03130 [Candidatus Cloacimonadota bacterium]